ncbi:MAG: histidine kinase [Bacteroidales bacterium]
MPKTTLREHGFIFFYASVWIIFALLFDLFLTRYLEVPRMIAAVDAAVSSVILAGLLLSLWFIIRYSNGDKIFSFRLLLHALTGLVLMISFWLFLSVYLLGLLFEKHSSYFLFLQDSYLMRAFFGLLMGMVAFLIFFSTNLIRATQEAAQRESHLQTLVQKTELQALKNQLNPHFIYNSLNSINSLTVTAPDKARAMVIRLSNFLRVALNQDATQLTSLRQELENSLLYLQIEQVRFGERLKFDFQIGEEHLESRLPVMILQPLLENAVKHGVQQASVPGTIVLTSSSTAGGIMLTLVNPFDQEFSRFKGEGVGLENIRNRLRLIYGNGKLLQVQQQAGKFVASLELPQNEGV